MKKLVLLLVAAALCATLAAGCGGGGKSKNQAYSSVKAYAAALDSICRPARAQVRALRPKSLSDFISKAPKLKSLIGNAVDKMDKLQPPDAVKSSAQDFISKSRDEVSRIDDLVAAAKANDRTKLQQVGAQIAADDQASNRDAAKIGAQVCARTG